MNNIERNKLDFLLTDIMPVEISELFSYENFYDFLTEQSKILKDIVNSLKINKAKNGDILFRDGGWSTIPLKYNILKGTQSRRILNLVQPISALNIYLFIECYQKEILNYLEEHACYSIRYHKKNFNLYYKKTQNKLFYYFEKRTLNNLSRAVLQQTGIYFKIYKFNSLVAFFSSNQWQYCNLQYRYFAKVDYKSCFNSIYTHAYKWIIESNTVDSKNARNTNLFITIDRILQNINGKSSNGVIVGPEFSRMIAEILLQHIDCEVKDSLLKDNLRIRKEYTLFRYVDDIYIFANTEEDINKIIKKIEDVASKYLLYLNEFKFLKDKTPIVLNCWLDRTRNLADEIGLLFYTKKEINSIDNEKFLLKDKYIPIDKIKDKFNILIHEYDAYKRYIVSYLLSTILNNVAKKNSKIKLLKKGREKNFSFLLDLAMYMYSYNLCFDHTQKIISLIVYIDSELYFRKKGENVNHDKLQNIIRKYSFIFENVFLTDICNWFIFFSDYKISLYNDIENKIVNRLEIEDNPILWANYLIYSKYYPKYFSEILNKIKNIIKINLDKLIGNGVMLKKEFWYILIFCNCPYLNKELKEQMKDILSKAENEVNKSNKESKKKINKSVRVNEKIFKLFYDFMKIEDNKKFFDWDNKNISQRITYRTFQRTIFKNYKKTNISLYSSID